MLLLFWNGGGAAAASTVTGTKLLRRYRRRLWPEYDQEKTALEVLQVVPDVEYKGLIEPISSSPVLNARYEQLVLMLQEKRYSSHLRDLQAAAMQLAREMEDEDDIEALMLS